jgi:hypothetical protein
MLRVWPDLSDDKSLTLFHKGVKGQWAADEIDWEQEVGLDKFERTSLARLITPVFVGEETALFGASAVQLRLMNQRNAAQRLFLASFALDEARHFEILTRLYTRLERKPLELRQLKEMWRYHAALLKQKDPVAWMWGILVSDIFAKHFYGTFYRQFPDTLFGELSGRILVDESRHQAFAEHFLKSAVLDRAGRRNLIAMRDELLELMEGMYVALRSDTDTFGIDGEAFFARMINDIETKITRLDLRDGDHEEGWGHDRDEDALIARLEADGVSGTQEGAVRSDEK